MYKDAIKTTLIEFFDVENKDQDGLNLVNVDETDVDILSELISDQIHNINKERQKDENPYQRR